LSSQLLKKQIEASQLPLGDAPAASLPIVVPARRKRIVKWLERSRGWPVISALLITLLVWWWVTNARVVPDFMVPTPQEVWLAFAQLVQTGDLWKHLGATLSEALLGFGAAFVVGSTLGYLLSRSALLSRVLGPYIAATQAMPMLALAPLLVLWFGLGLSSKVIICALIVFFPILVNTTAGLRSVDKDLVDASYTMGAGRWQALRHVEIPLALHTLLAGIRMGLTLSLTGAIIGEFISSDSGLGFLMTMARTNFDSAMLFAAAITMTSLAIFAYVGVGWLEHWLIDWD
jgi:NitT/TauT family transport system permease protein